MRLESASAAGSGLPPAPVNAEQEGGAADTFSELLASDSADQPARFTQEPASDGGPLNLAIAWPPTAPDQPGGMQPPGGAVRMDTSSHRTAESLQPPTAQGVTDDAGGDVEADTDAAPAPLGAQRSPSRSGLRLEPLTTVGSTARLPGAQSAPASAEMPRLVADATSVPPSLVAARPQQVLPASMLSVVDPPVDDVPMPAAGGLSLAGLTSASSLVAAPPTAVVMQSALAAGVANADQLAAQLQLQFREGIGKATVRLHPESLGELQVAVETAEQHVRVVLAARQPESLDWLQQSLPRLQTALDDAGFTRVEVEIQRQFSGGADDARDQGASEQSSPSPKSQVPGAGRSPGGRPDELGPDVASAVAHTIRLSGLDTWA